MVDLSLQTVVKLKYKVFILLKTMNKKIPLIFVICFSFLLKAQENDTINKLLIDLNRQEIDSSKIFTNLELGWHYFSENKDSSFYYYNKALSLSKKLDLNKYEAEALFEIGVNYELLNNYGAAIEKYKESLTLYNELGDKERCAEIYNYVGNNYSSLFSENKALEFYLKSLNGYAEINDEEGIALNLNDIGNLYYDFENYESANKYFYDALEIYKELNDKEGIAVCYTNIGNSLSDGGDFYGGLDFYNKSIEFQKELDDQLGVVVNYNNIGDSYIQLKEYERALDFLTEALVIAKKIKDREITAVIYLNMADVQNKMQNYRSAITNANLSNKIARELGKVDFVVDNYKQLAESYELRGDNVKSYFYYKEYVRLKDSLFSNEKQKKVLFFNALSDLEEQQFTINALKERNAVAQLKYENEKKISYLLIISILIFAVLIVIMIFQQTAKNKAINLLKHKNYQIEQMNHEIQVQKNNLELVNRTKDKFFSIIAHDLKNPFNSINGFTELLIENWGIYSDEKNTKFLKIIKGSTNRASSLLNNLLIWANAQTGNLEFKPEKIEIVKQVSDVVSLVEIQAINKDIRVFNSVHHNLFVMADKNMLNTVLRNLISNAIKFSKPDSEVLISSVFNANYITITIKDEGIGMDEATIEKLFSIEFKNSHVGTANEQGSGLGLILCKDFVERNGGEIWVKSTIGCGSEFKFTLPIYKEV